MTPADLDLSASLIRYVDEMGAGDGLRLMLRTAEIEQAQLMYERVMLAINPLPRTSIRGESWRTVTVRYTPQGASVSLDETPLFTHVPLPHFAPTHRWRIAIGARCGRLDDRQRLDALTFTRGASLELAYTAVRLSANGRDFSPNTTLFEYYAPPTVLAVEPPCGPLDGGTSVTIRGLGLQRPAETLANGRSSGYKCGWGACDCALRTDCVCANVTAAHWDVELGALVCTSPPWLGDAPAVGSGSSDASLQLAIGTTLRSAIAPAALHMRAEAPLLIALNGQSFTSASHNFWRYAHPVPGTTLLQLEPLFGPTLGGTLLRIRPLGGLPHGSRYVCRFGRVEVNASAADERVLELRCLSPPFTAFHHLNSSSSSSSSANRSSHGRNASASASFSLSSLPVQPPSVVDLYLSLNGQQFAPLGFARERFTYYSEPMISAISPSGGAIEGGTRVTLSGFWPAETDEVDDSKRLLRCRFGREVVRAQRSAHGDLVCESPRLAHALEAELTNVAEQMAPDLRNPSVMPLSHWQLGEATRAGNAFYAQDTALVLSAVADHGVAQPLTVSFNGLDYTRSQLPFRWLLPPRLVDVRPILGPADGETIVRLRGEGLWEVPHLQCRFGTIAVDATVVSEWFHADGAPRRQLEATCISPPMVTFANATATAAVSVPFLVSTNAQQFVGQGFAFTYYAPTPVSQPMRPTLGPHLGGTYIGLPHVPISRGARYLCRIGGPEGQLVPAQIGSRAGLPSATAYFRDAEDDMSRNADQGGGDAEDARSNDGVAVRPELMCAMPFVPVIADVGIEVSVNGQQFAPVDANFSYHSPMVTAGLAPLSGPSDGETDILVRLIHVSLSPLQLLATAPQLPPEYVCRFEDTWRAAALAEPPPLLRADEQLSPNRGALGRTISHENRSLHYDLEALRALECASGGAESDAAACAAPLSMLTLRCSTPPMRAVRTSGDGPAVTEPIVSASVNAQDFAEARSAAFHYYPPPHVSSVHPTLGPLAGRTVLTVRGSGLYGRGEHHLCRFVMRDEEPSNPLRGVPRNATERSLVALSQQPPPLLDSEPFYPLAGADALYEALPLLTPASYDAPSRTLRCVTPAIWPAENASLTDAPSIRLRLEVSANGQQYTSDGVEFHMHPSAVLSQFTPSGGPAAGGTAIRINGFGLSNGSEYVCRAGVARVLVGGRMDYGTGQLHCTMPSHAACEPAGTEIGVSAVAVSTNGQQFSADFFFEFAAPATVSRITPAAGPQLGGILVQAQGANLRTGHAISGSALPALSCRFGETSVPATFENASASVLCTSPARPAGVLAFELTSNGQDFSHSSIVWVQYVAPSLSVLQPPAGPQRGGTSLTIAGTHLRVSELATDARYVCGFGSGPPIYVWPEPAVAVGMVPSEGVQPSNGTNATETTATGNVTMPPMNRTDAANATETSAPPGTPSPLAPPSMPPGLPPFPPPPPDRSLATVIILPAAMTNATYDPSTGLLRCRSPSIDLAVRTAQYGANVSSDDDAQYDANATRPRVLPLQVPVRVALHDPPDQHWSPLESALLFGYYDDGALNVISPRTGPVTGGTRLMITGGPFARYLSSSSPSGGSSGGSSMPIGAEAYLEEGDIELQRCILGDSSSIHSLAFPRIDSGSQLVCTTTALARSANGAESLLSFTGESLLSFTGGQEDVGALLGGSVALLGGGRMRDGVLELPEVRPGGLVYGGAIVTHGLQAPHAAAFDVTFEVALHRPTSPEGTAVSGGSVAGGVSFNFGPIPDEAILDDGGYEQGFVLSLLPADGLRLRSNGIEVGFDPSARSNGWTLMRVRSNGTHVSIAQDGAWVPNLIDVAVALQPATTPDGFATHERWRFAFGGRPSGDVAHTVTHFHVRSVSLLSSLTLPVLHAANGQQFGPSSVNFTWLLPPVTSHVYPSSGARYGATTVHVYGANLAGGDDYRCRFDAPMLPSRPLTVPAIEVPSTASSGTSVRCVTPELLSTGWVLLTLTLNGQQYSHTAVNFTVLGNGAVGVSAAPSPAWANLSLPSYSWGAAHLEQLQLWPVLGPTNGQTTIQVFGAGFDGGSEFRCRFLLHSGEVLGTVSATLESPSADGH